MNLLIAQLVHSVLKKESLDECSVQELQQLVDQYPYFGAVQLLLSEKIKSDNSSLSKEQLQTTSLFFQNPLWLDHLMNDAGKLMVDSVKEPEIILPEEEKPAAVETTVPVNNDPELIFEPFHTVDYFASQGIKFREEEKPADKFGQQLKSFTEWLKTLRRMPVSEIVKEENIFVEEKVEQLAQYSLEDREVLTETMAEVWEKQGNHAKAIEIYNKLSLLDPSKSSYFAAKIEPLKK